MEYSIEDLKPFIFGLPWFGEADWNLYRLPRSIIPNLSQDMQNHTKNAAGAMIRFKSKTKIIGFDIRRITEGNMAEFSSIGQFSLDVYCDGAFWIYLEIPPERRFIWFETDGSNSHEYTIYFPLYSEVELFSLVVENPPDEDNGRETEIYPSDEPFLDGKIVVYGSSITQGAYASRPGMAYPARLGRKLAFEVVNLGFGGCGKGEPNVADKLAEIQDVSLYIMDWGCNLCALDEVHLIESRYPEMIQKLNAAHPEIPILFISPQTFILEFRDESFCKAFQLIRAVILETYENAKGKGINCLYLDGQELVGPGELDKTVDGVHCNDWGFTCYIDKIEPLARKLLKISQVPNNIQISQMPINK
jgi:GDSL-like Lipase/Acylhydrolase family/N-terminus of Esterase_SGNH_hydro-type